MNKILISGYYGFGNQGDEAILEALVNDIKKRYEDVEITVLTANAEYTRKNYNVKVINRNKYIDTIKSIFRTDILISGGGSLLQDVTSPRSLYYYLSILFLGIIFNKKILLISHGIGPINNKINQYLTRIILDRVDYISVREEHSKEDLLDIGVKKEINLSVDPVIDLTKADKSFGHTVLNGLIDQEKKTIGFSLRSTYFLEDKIYNSLKEFIEEYKNEYNLVFLPLHYYQDVEVLKKIKTDFSYDVITLNEKFNSNEIISIIENFDILIGERLHALIFSVVSETPIIGISYDPKIDYFLKSVDMEPIFKVQNFDKDKLSKEVNQIFNNYIENKINLGKELSKLKGQFKVNIKALDKYIKN